MIRDQHRWRNIKEKKAPKSIMITLIFFVIITTRARDIVSEVEELDFEEARKLMLKMAQLKNRLRELGIIRIECKVTAGYAEWFCSKKFGLELCDMRECGYDALSKYGDRVQITSRTGSDIDFRITFDGIRVDKFDYLLAVFINEKTWMINAVYKVPHDIVKEFLSVDGARRFEWRRESRSLSLRVYPDDNNMIVL